MSVLLNIYDKSINEFKKKLKDESNFDLDKKSNNTTIHNVKNVPRINISNLKQKSETMNSLVMKDFLTKGALNLSNIKMLAPLNVLLLTDLKGVGNCPIKINTNQNLSIGNYFQPSKDSDKRGSTFLNIIKKNVGKDVILNNFTNIKSDKFNFKSSKKNKNHILIFKSVVIKNELKISLFPNQNILIIAHDCKFKFSINSQIECCPKPEACPKPANLIPYYGAIGGLVLIIILLLVFNKSYI